MVILKGVECGTVANEEEAEKCLREARKIVALQAEELTFMEIDMELRGSEVMFGILDDRGDVLNNMTKVLRGSVEESVQSSYLVKVNEILPFLSPLSFVPSSHWILSVVFTLSNPIQSPL